MAEHKNTYRIILCSMIALVSMCTISLAQVSNPADAHEKPAKTLPPNMKERLRSWEMPEIVVTADREAALYEEQKIGSYGQPRWTATRRFLTTRGYVRPEGKMEVEYWLRTTFNKDGTVSYRSLYELEFGLPHRLQLDIYLRTDQKTEESEIKMSEQIELRYALADWGELPGNPTLYLEWIRHHDDPDQIEPKILFCGEMAPRWHWGLNLVAEMQVSGEEREHEYSARGGVSYSKYDSKFAIGAECEAVWADTEDDRGNFSESLVLGPSIQYHPNPQMTINAAPLFGVTNDSPDAQVWFNCGWEF
jgi:hypothetical protein